MPDGRVHAPSLPGGRPAISLGTGGPFSPVPRTPTARPTAPTGPSREDLDRVQRRLRFAQEIREALLATAGKPLVSPAVGEGGIRPPAILQSIRARGKGDYPTGTEALRTLRGFERREFIINLLSSEEAFNDDKFFAKTVDVLSPLEQRLIFRAWEGADEEELAVIDDAILKDYKARGDVQDITGDQPFAEKAFALKSLLDVNKPFASITRGIGSRLKGIPFVGETVGKAFVAGSPSTLFEKLGDKVLSDEDRAQPSLLAAGIADTVIATESYRQGVAPVSEAAEKIPFAGPTIKREIDFAPITIPLALFGPTRLMLASTVGTIAAGAAARAATDDEKIITTAEIAGGVLPFAPGAASKSLSLYQRLRPTNLPVEPIGQIMGAGSKVKFAQPAEGAAGNWIIVSMNKFGAVMKRPGAKGAGKNVETLTRVKLKDLIAVGRPKPSTKPVYKTAVGLRATAKQQVEEFGRPDNAALYNQLADLSEAGLKEGKVLGVETGKALEAARKAKELDALEGARNALTARADEIPGFSEVTVDQGWALLGALRKDYGKISGIKAVEGILQNSDDILIRLPATGELVPANAVRWVPAKGELGDLVVTLKKVMQDADVPPNIAKFLQSVEKKIPDEITPQMRKIARDYGIPLQPKSTPDEVVKEIQATFASVEVVTGQPLRIAAGGQGGGIESLQLPRTVTELIVGGTKEDRITLAPRVLNSLRATAGDKAVDDLSRGLELIHALDPSKTMVLGRKSGRLVTGFLEGEATAAFGPSRVTDEATNILKRIDAGESVTSRTFGYDIQGLRRVASENGFDPKGMKKPEIIAELQRRSKGLEGIKQEGTISVRRIALNDEEMRGMGISERTGEVLGIRGGQQGVAATRPKTGQPFDTTVYRAYGDFNEAGRYYTQSLEAAQKYAVDMAVAGAPERAGLRMTREQISFQNPLVVRDKMRAAMRLSGKDEDLKRRLEKIFNIDDLDDPFERVSVDELAEMLSFNPEGQRAFERAIAASARRQGFDGIIFRELDEMVALRSSVVGQTVVSDLPPSAGRIVNIPTKSAVRITPEEFQRVGASGQVLPAGNIPIDSRTMMLFPTRKGTALLSEEIEELASLRSVLRKDLTSAQKRTLNQLATKEGAFNTSEFQSNIASEKARLLSAIRSRTGGFRRGVEPKPGTTKHAKWQERRNDQQADRIRLGILEGYGDVVPDKKIPAELAEEIADNTRSLASVQAELDRLLIPVPAGAAREAAEESIEAAFKGPRRTDEDTAALLREAEGMRVDFAKTEQRIADLVKKGAEKGRTPKQEELFRALKEQEEHYIEKGIHKPITTGRLEALFDSYGIRDILGGARGYVPIPAQPKSHFIDQLAKTRVFQDVSEPRLLDMTTRYWGTRENIDMVKMLDFGPIVNGLGDIARASLGPRNVTRGIERVTGAAGVADRGRIPAIVEQMARSSNGKNLSFDAFVKQLVRVPKGFKGSRETYADTTVGSFRNSIARVLKDLKTTFGEERANEARRTLYESHFNIFTMLQDPAWFKPGKDTKVWLGKWVDQMKKWNSVADQESIRPNVFQKTFLTLFDERAIGTKPGQVSLERLKEKNLEGTLREFFTWVFESAPRRKLGGIVGSRPPEEFIAPAESVFYAAPSAIGQELSSKLFIGWADELGVSVKRQFNGLVLKETQPTVKKVTDSEFSEFGRLLDHISSPSASQTPLGSIGDVFSQIARGKLILDGSFFSVQGNLGTVAKTGPNPAGVLKMWKSLLQVTHSDVAYVDWLATNAPRIAMNNLDGQNVGMAAVVGGQFRNTWFLEKYTPLLGKPAFGRFREWNDRLFERGLLVLKTNMIDDLLEDVKMFTKLPEERQDWWTKNVPFFGDLQKALGGLVRQKSPLENRRAIVQLTNNILTGDKAPITSTRAAIESTVFFTPGFFRAQLKWHLKALNPTSLEGFFASRMLLKHYAFLSMLGKLQATAVGEGDKFNVDKPWRADFLGFRVPGGGYVPVFPSRAVQTITARLLKGAFDRDPQQVGYWIETFLEGRGSPVATAAYQSIKGEDFLGRKYKDQWDYYQAWGSLALPISIESVADSSIEAFVRGNPRFSGSPTEKLQQIAGEGFIDAAGRNINPPNPIEELNFIVDKAAKDEKLDLTFPDKVPKWNDLPQADQDLVISVYPETQKWVEILEYNRRSRSNDLETRRSEDFQGIRAAREWAFTRTIDTPFQVAGVDLAEDEYTFNDVYELWRDQAITGDDFRLFMEDTEKVARGEVRAIKARLKRDGLDLDEEDTEEIVDKRSGERASTLFDLALLEYQEIQPSDAVDTVIVAGREIEITDWDAFQTAREAALAPYPQEVQDRVIAWNQRLEETVPALREKREAGEVITEWFEIPRYRGLSTKEGEFIDIMKREIRERYNAARDRVPVEISGDEAKQLRTAIMVQMVRNGSYTVDQKRLAIVALLMLGSRELTDSLENPKRISFVLENPGLLAWYNFTFDVIPRELRNLLPPEFQAQYDQQTLEQAAEDADILAP